MATNEPTMKTGPGCLVLVAWLFGVAFGAAGLLFFVGFSTYGFIAAWSTSRPPA